MKTIALMRHYDASVPLAWTTRSVSPGLFTAQARRLAQSLPQAERVINLCEDRYHFLLAFAAALIAGKLTLTPPSRAPEAIARLAQEAGSCHTVDDDAVAAALAQMGDLAEDSDIPQIPADQPAIVLHTSGSTGKPAAHGKTWGMLAQGADQLQRAFGVQPGAAIVGTVPPQHMFGLESTIVFPLQWGCTIRHERPLLPADIEQTVQAAQAPVWLMTTPVHLRACEGLRLSGVAGAISATMPLDRAAAQAAEAVLGAPLHEIYGSTESGITATRRPAQSLEWQLCADFELRIDDSQAWVTGLRVAAPLALGDNIVLHGPGRFSLNGRSGDMIKIAGKRTSLAALNAELLAIDGVIDGSFHQPPGADARLCAFVVAPGVETAAVVAKLRERIDAVFLPRPLQQVTSLPRDANGKLPRAALERLHAEHNSPTNRDVPHDHPALDGHFPGNPIVPGVLLLSEVIREAERSHRVRGIKQAKFHSPLLPGQAYAIRVIAAATGLKFEIVRADESKTPIASGLLDCEVP